MSQANRSRSHARLYLFTGLFAGILIGFGTALILQNYGITDRMPLMHGGRDSLDIQQNSQSTRIQKRVKKSDIHVQDDTMDNDQLASGDNMNPTDSMYVAGSDEDTLAGISGDGNDVVFRDELVATKRVKVKYNGEKTAMTSGSDSLLTSLTGVKPPPGFFPEYKLEFWRNPVNYKGYKVIRDRIVLFGLPADQSYQLSVAGDQLLLTTSTNQYILKEAVDLMPLVPKK